MNSGDDLSKIGGGDYERPDCRYRCGRGAMWRKPCAAGPTPEGKCGGTSECEPALRHGKFACRRPASAGGPCAEGPKADGTCAHVHPPCIPRLTLRARRGRLTWQLCGLAALLLAAGFHFGIRTKSRPFAADPGPLSATHAHFTAAQGCGACHAAHDAGLGGLTRAVFAGADMNSKCATCHPFDEAAESPHNEGLLWLERRSPNRRGATISSPRADSEIGAPIHDLPKRTDCRMCHAEHRGGATMLTTITDEQCHACHQKKFHTFDRDHPEFSADFPRVFRAGIKFDHAKHLGQHFSQPEYARRAPQACATCHPSSSSHRHVATRGFDDVCAGCHADQIAQNELVLLRLPEPSTDPTKLGAEDATPFMTWSLQRGSGTNYGANLQRFIGALAGDGDAALTNALGVKPGTPHGVSLLAGLNPELLLRPAGLWTNRQKFEPPPSKPSSGWYWMEDLYPELHYKPSGHADPVARAWLEFALDLVRESTTDADRKRATDFANDILRPAAGVGRCTKCHAVHDVGNGWRFPQWRYESPTEASHVRFSHAPHVGLKRCEECHVLNARADYEAQFKDSATEGVSSFKSIPLENCRECHAQNKVRADCGLCHEYHRGPMLREIKTAAR